MSGNKFKAMLGLEVKVEPETKPDATTQVAGSGMSAEDQERIIRMLQEREPQMGPDPRTRLMSIFIGACGICLMLGILRIGNGKIVASNVALAASTVIGGLLVIYRSLEVWIDGRPWSRIPKRVWLSLISLGCLAFSTMLGSGVKWITVFNCMIAIVTATQLRTLAREPR